MNFIRALNWVPFFMCNQRAIHCQLFQFDNLCIYDILELMLIKTKNWSLLMKYSLFSPILLRALLIASALSAAPLSAMLPANQIRTAIWKKYTDSPSANIQTNAPENAITASTQPSFSSGVYRAIKDVSPAYAIAWASVIAHESGHALMAKLLQGSPSRMVFGAKHVIDQMLQNPDQFIGSSLAESPVFTQLSDYDKQWFILKNYYSWSLQIGNALFVSANPLLGGRTIRPDMEVPSWSETQVLQAGPLCGALVCDLLLDGSRLLQNSNPSNKLLMKCKEICTAIDNHPLAHASLHFIKLINLLNLLPKAGNDGYYILQNCGASASTLQNADTLSRIAEPALIMGTTAWLIYKMNKQIDAQIESQRAQLTT